MLLANPEVTQAQMEQIILAEHGEAGRQQGYSEEEVVAAFMPGRESEQYATLEVAGVEFSSFRFESGALLGSDSSRGGLELSPAVTGIKVFHKSTGMRDKHALDGTPDVGGKGGIVATPQELDEIGPDGRRELFMQHALAHGINPHTKRTATDIGSSTVDMDAIAEALLPKYGNQAGAAASGVSEKYGGEPTIHMPKTGRGAAIYMDRYLRSIAPRNERVAEAINGGDPLRIVTQGLGKAGFYFTVNMPSYVQPIGALERNGSVTARNGGYLNRQALLAASQANGLSQEAAKNMGSTWMPKDAVHEFWATNGAELLAPAFDEYQVDDEDIQTFAAQGGIAVVPIANFGTTPEGQKAANELELDVLPFAAVNIGGTVSSKLVGSKILGAPWWTPAIYEQNWNRTLIDVANTTLDTRKKLSAEQGGFVPLDEAVGTIVVRRVVGRLRQLRG